jgi:hypothetical protein
MTTETASQALVAIARKIIKQRVGDLRPLSIEDIYAATWDAASLFACTDDDIGAAREVLIGRYITPVDLSPDQEAAHERRQLGSCGN